MTKSTQQIADEMARKCAKGIYSDVFSVSQDRVVKHLLDTLPLLELLEVARLAQSILHTESEEEQDDVIERLDNAITNLQKKVEL